MDICTSFTVQMQEPYYKFSCKRKLLDVAPFKMLSFSSHILLWALIQLFSPFLEYKVWPVAIKSLSLHSTASSRFMGRKKTACTNTSVWSTSFQYPLGKPSLIHGQVSPCTVLFTTVPAGDDVCVCSPVRSQIFSWCSHSCPPTQYSWFFAMMVKSIKRPQLQQFRSLKTWTVIYFEDHERNTRFCWRSLDLCLLCWSVFGYCTAPTSAFLIQCVGGIEASSEVYWDWCGNY
jgi:hypothetical protein